MRNYNINQPFPGNMSLGRFFFIFVIMGSLFVLYFITKYNIPARKLSPIRDKYNNKHIDVTSQSLQKDDGAYSENTGIKRTNAAGGKTKKLKKATQPRRIASDEIRLRKTSRLQKFAKRNKHFVKPPVVAKRINQIGRGDKKMNIYKQWIESSSHFKAKHSALSEKPIAESGNTKTILIYTPLFNNNEWPNLKNDQTNDYLKKHNCPVKNCQLSYDRERIAQSDVVVFHARDMMNGVDLRTLSDTERPKDQIWVYFSSENPLNSHIDPLFDDLFDWTMTYKHDSDIWNPYARYYKLKTQKTQDDGLINYAETKTKLISWLVSHCDLLRDAVVHDMEQFLSVDVAGQCASHFSSSFQCDKDCDEKIQDYKFYLAFESQHCDEYVTEKYWYRAIRNNVVPIVLGGGPYNDPRVAIPGSYIDVLEFETVADLVKHIKYLDENDTAYNEYFRWKQKYQFWEPECDWPFEPYWSCDMCVRLNNGVTRKEKYSLSKFWGVDKDCEGRIGKLRNFLEASGHDFTKDYDANVVREARPYDSNTRELEYEEEIVVTSKTSLVGLDKKELDKILEASAGASEHYIIACIFIVSVVGLGLYFQRVHFS